MKILIIDDSKTSKVVMTALLQKMGHEVLSASNGLEAIQMLKKEGKIEIIFLDWYMPEMDGPEFLKNLKLCNLIGPVVIMLTAEKNLEKIGELMVNNKEVGLLDYVAKPYNKEVISEKIEKIRMKLTVRSKAA